MTRSSARQAVTRADRESAAMMVSIKVSMTGSAMPARLFEPLSAAACEEKYERSESPGVEEKLNRSTVMSKSKPSRRARYWTGSTIRSDASIPSVARFLMNGMWCGSAGGFADEELDVG